MVNNYMSVEKGTPRDDDRALFLDVKLADSGELDQFKDDGGLANTVFFDGRFSGQAYDENGSVCLGLPLSTVICWRYAA